ncbi:MAG: hypothetical protein A2Z14_17395 [Chloroflexi bacterium RBG_16_48_8]|nr:MAG: hypothetical protein A2Z14_17395 [Chloroflexi bacterium RBG_16_48_8]
MDGVMVIFIIGTSFGVLLTSKVERIEGSITLLLGIAHRILAQVSSWHTHAFALLVSGVLSYS